MIVDLSHSNCTSRECHLVPIDAVTNQSADKLHCVRTMPSDGADSTRWRQTNSLFARKFVLTRSQSTIESGEKIREAVHCRITESRCIVDALAEVITQEAIGQWMTTPNDPGNGIKPLEVIERGEVGRIWQMIFVLPFGVPC